MKTIKKLALMLLLLTLSVSGSAQSRNGQTYQDPEETGDWYLMLEDFEGVWPTINSSNLSKISTQTDHTTYMYWNEGWNDNYTITINIPSSVIGVEFDALVVSMKGHAYDSDKNMDIYYNDVKIAQLPKYTSENWDEKSLVLSSPLKFAQGTSVIQLKFEHSGNPKYGLDNIRLKYKEAPTPVDPSAPEITTDLNAEYSVNQGGALALTIGASGNPTPTYQWYSNATATTEGATAIEGATDVTYNVPTTTIGDVYYYCVATNSEGSATSTIAKVTVTEKPASKSKNGTCYEEGGNYYYMIEDFEDGELAWSGSNFTPNLDGDDENHYMSTTNSDGNNYSVSTSVSLPEGMTFSEEWVEAIVFDLKQAQRDMKDKELQFKIDNDNVAKAGANTILDDWEDWKWHIDHSVNVTNWNDLKEFVFDIFKNGYGGKYSIDNIRLKLKKAGPTPVDPTSGDCGEDAHWAYDATTTSLAITGTGEMTDFAEGATPWNAYLSAITTVDVAEGITKVGANAFKGINSSAVLTFHSIPAFGADAVVEGKANLALVDANHPFVASDFTNAPTFAEASYVRSLSKDVLATFVLPFVPADITASPIKFYAIRNTTASSVSFALQESIEAGVPYLIENTGDEDEFTLEATNVNLTALVSQTQFDMNLVGVYQYRQVRDDNAYALNNNNQFQRTSKNINLQPFRAYLYAPNSVNAKIDVDFGEPTGINDVKGSRLDDHNALYNLQGVRVKAGYKGVVLTNGKKFIAQ
ncbi:MAG: immunoglobulin domain-containing protein [Prevotella sp.]|nr:immunoglobulin domain-containing protein [Candidatus Equicola faecalis]